MQEITEIKPDFDALSTEYKDGQVFTVHASPDNQQLIMMTLNNAEYGTDKTLMERMIMENAICLCEKGIQTETVFGLQDLPTVQELVRKTIAKTRSQEVTQNAADMVSGPVNGIFTCAICGKVYRNKVSWQNHLAAHNGDDVFMCGVCGQLFNVRMNLKAHLEIHIREERKLKRQQDSMYGSSELKIGGVYMPGDIIPKDDEKVLNKQFAMDSLSQSDILDITSSHTDSYVAATEEVHEELSSDANDEDSSQGVPLVAEKNTMENTESEGSTYIYACNICGEQYSVKEECERHLKIHTGGDGDGEPETSSPQKPIPTPPVNKPDESKLFPNINKNKHFSAYIYACNVCGKQYTNKSNCKRHMMIHTDDRRLYECDHCGKRFSQKYEVRMHSRIHTGEKPFTCGVCGKNFTERGNWRRHTQIHVRPQEASPYRCGICCKGFFHPEKLQVHLQIHSGQRPFICTVCGRKVKKIGDMYRHLRTHTGEKPYKCQVCGKGFAQNGNLKDHMKVHTGEKPHICDLCGKDFARKILLKEHIKNHHKGATLKDLTDAALEEIERQEAAMEALENADDLEEAVVHEISAGSVPKIMHTTSGNTIVIRGRRITLNAADEEQLLSEEQEMELQEVHASLSEKELEAAHVLTVVQDGDNMVYTYNTNQLHHIVLEGSEESKPVLDVLEVQNT